MQEPLLWSRSRTERYYSYYPTPPPHPQNIKTPKYQHAPGLLAGVDTINTNNFVSCVKVYFKLIIDIFTWKAEKKIWSLWEKDVTISYFHKILVLPVMTKNIVKSKEHCSPTRSKTVVARHFVEEKPQKALATLTQTYQSRNRICSTKDVKKTVATLPQVAPDDQSRNTPKNGQGRLTKKNAFWLSRYVYLCPSFRFLRFSKQGLTRTTADSAFATRLFESTTHSRAKACNDLPRPILRKWGSTGPQNSWMGPTLGPIMANHRAPNIQHCAKVGSSHLDHL